MTTLDLRSDDGLRDACSFVCANDTHAAWQSRLVDFLREVENASLEERASQAFQLRLWDDNPIAATGQGQVRMTEALDDAAFRRRVAELTLTELPANRGERMAAIESVYEEVLSLTTPFCAKRPLLKILRLMATCFPLDFTSIASLHALGSVEQALFGKRSRDPVARHVRVRQRVDDLLGPFDTDDLEQVASRLRIPWLLYELIQKDDPKRTTTISPTGEERLEPLPANRRRRGLSAFKGLFSEMLSILEYVRDEPTRDELLDYLRSTNPTSKDATIRLITNVLTSEFGVIRHDGARYTLTPRGEALVDTGDPDEVRDWLLTRILGVDHVIAYLRDNGDEDRKKLDAMLQSVNPGWTTTFVPRVLVKWLIELDVVAKRPSGLYGLTERGQEWAALIHWTPDPLEATSFDEPDDDEDEDADTTGAIERPPLDVITDRIRESGQFSSDLIASLHMGLWAQPRRHFAILTGLSGSGKTLLARAYGKALIGDSHEPGLRMRTIPVQPGWYDPTPLFGYVNPLAKDSYESTPFLELLLHAVANPQKPYVVVLDEMNLSHPEQYFAPMLSAMETGAELHLHSKGSHFDGIPGRVPYPSNLVVIGTVNMDETTMGLSDKVLDRAFVQEFWRIDLDAWPGWTESRLPATETDTVRQVLAGLMAALEPARLHFGWRVIGEVVGFLAQRHETKADLAFTDALDHVVHAKIVPKLRGEDAPRFRTALEATERVLMTFDLSRAAAKVAELRADLDATGSARFWR